MTLLGKPCELCGVAFRGKPGASPSEFRRTRFCSRTCGNRYLTERRTALSLTREWVLRRFEAKYLPEPMSGCWLWTGALLPDGYGSFRVRGAVSKAHRAAWELHVGPVPDGMHVLHRCDVRCCVNPNHLFIGTNGDNVADRVSKERSAHGTQVSASC